MHFFQRNAKTFAISMVIAAFFLSGSSLAAEQQKIGTVNFRKAVEMSKLGKKEQETFEMMKNQMESIISEKEKSFNEIAKKIQDEDFRDSQSPEALQKLEQQYRSLGGELQQAQNQYIQALQQANIKILQKIADIIGQASKNIAEKKGLDIVLNDDNVFFHADQLDITNEVVQVMDTMYNEDLKKAITSPSKSFDINSMQSK